MRERQRYRQADRQTKKAREKETNRYINIQRKQEKASKRRRKRQ